MTRVSRDVAVSCLQMLIVSECIIKPFFLAKMMIFCRGLNIYTDVNAENNAQS